MVIRCCLGLFKYARESHLRGLRPSRAKTYSNLSKVELDITSLVRQKVNLLALRVLCWGAAAYLEDQDMPPGPIWCTNAS